MVEQKVCSAWQVFDGAMAAGFVDALIILDMLNQVSSCLVEGL